MSTRDRRPLDQLIEEAKDDPKLFHDLIFNPEEALQGLDYLDQNMKGRLIETRPEDLIGGLVGIRPESVERPAPCDMMTRKCDAGQTIRTHYVNCGYGETCTHTISAASPMEEQFREDGIDMYRPYRIFQPRVRSYLDY